MLLGTRYAVHRSAETLVGLLLVLAGWASLSAQGQAAESATFRVTFQGTWTTAATPGGVPGGAHFSRLIGAVHNDRVIFWQSGAMASRGIESVAETGGTATFKTEINASAHATAIIERSLSGGPTIEKDVEFEVTTDHPLVTLITMIAPSPDWFVGVSGQSFADGAGQWQERVEVDLYPYDAGTEDGDGFSLSNPATVPRGVITSIGGTGKFTNEPMAKLTFVCQSGCTPSPPPPPPPPEPVVRVVPLFPSADDTNGPQGFVRVINRSGENAELQVVAIDDMGMRSEPLTLSVNSDETVQFNSDDLEMGNDEKGLSGGTGARQGDLRLELTSPPDIEVLSYIRTKDGFLTAMHDIVPSDGGSHRVAIFNPGSNTNQKSLLRLINRGTEAAAITIEGIDDKGVMAGPVQLTLPAGGAGTVSSASLESNASRDDPEQQDSGVVLEGELGDGTGKWRLTVNSDQPVSVMSLLESPTGHLTNLSTSPYARVGNP